MAEKTNNRLNSVLLSEIRRIRSAKACAVRAVADDERTTATIPAATADQGGFLGGEVR